MPVVSATVLQPETYVRLMTSWADASSETHVRFVRVNPVTCEEVVVRVHTAYDPSGQYILLSCDDTAVVWDTEAPLGVDLEYRVDGLVTGLSVTSVTVNIDDNGENHLKDPLHPCNDVRVGTCIDDPVCEDTTPGTFYIGHSSDVRNNHSISLLPVNGKRPVVISRQRQDPESMLRLGTQHCDDADAMVAINDPGTPLLWQSLPQYCIADRYISVGTYEIERLGVDQRLEVRIHSLPYVQVDRPVGPGQGVCGTRFMDLCEEFATWDELEAAGLTWNDLLLGNATGMFPAARRWIDVETEFATWADVEDGGTRTWQELRDGS